MAYTWLITYYAVKHYLFQDEGPYRIETSPLICKANRWTGFYMTRTSVMKELKTFCCPSGHKIMEIFWMSLDHTMTSSVPIKVVLSVQVLKGCCLSRYEEKLGDLKKFKEISKRHGHLYDTCGGKLLSVEKSRIYEGSL